MNTVRPPSPSPVLNLHAVVPASRANGPGRRAVVWTQGCRLRCPGCSNAGTHSHRPRRLVHPDALAEWILALPGTEGVTVSGGEPFEQPVAVARLCRRVRAGGLSVMVFTGWPYPDARRCGSDAVQDLLRHIDLLVDGPFIQDLADPNLLWRGSRNQHVRLLSDRYGADVLRGRPPRLEALLGEGSRMALTGFPDAAALDTLARRLWQEHGIRLEPSPRAGSS